MKYRLSGAIGVVMLIAAACSVLGQECTEIGCSSMVRITLEGRGLNGTSGHFDAEMCFDDRCEEAFWSFGETLRTPPHNPDFLIESVGPDFQASLYLPGDEYDEETAHEVSLIVKDTVGETTHVERTVRLDRIQPNGGGCSPICWVAEMALPPDKAQQG